MVSHFGQKYLPQKLPLLDTVLKKCAICNFWRHPPLQNKFSFFKIMNSLRETQTIFCSFCPLIKGEAKAAGIESVKYFSTRGCTGTACSKQGAGSNGGVEWTNWRCGGAWELPSNSLSDVRQVRMLHPTERRFFVALSVLFCNINTQGFNCSLQLRLVLSHKL